MMRTAQLVLLSAGGVMAVRGLGGGGARVRGVGGNGITRASVVRGAAAFAASGLAAHGASASAAPPAVQKALDPDTWPLDEAQWTSYDPSRTVLYDTARQSFLTPDPKAHLAAALQQRGRADGAALPRVIFAGEEHTNPLHHRYQLQLIKAVNELDDAPLAIGLEMFYRQHQPALDEYVFGGGSFATLKKKTRWASTWGYNFSDYAKVFAYAKKHRVRLVGLNVPYPLVSMVASYGLERVPAELSPYLPEIDLGNAAHYARFEASMGSMRAEAEAGGQTSPHGGGTASSFQRSYEAMTLWDEYMAASISRYLEPKATSTVGADGVGGRYGAPGKDGPRTADRVRDATWRDDGRMVVLVGAMHVRGRVGVPDRVTRRSGLPTFSVVPLSVPWAAIEGTPGLPAIERPLAASEADWVLYTQPTIRDGGRDGRPGSARYGPVPHVSFSALRVGTQVAPVISV